MNDKFDITQLENEITTNIFSKILLLAKLKRLKKDGIIIEISPEIKQGKYDISKYLNHRDFNNIIYEFYAVLEEKFSHCNLGVFYKNLKNLKIKVRNYNIIDILSMIIFQRLNAGCYNTNKNKLTLLNEGSEEVRSIICHELLHMASTIETEYMTFVGFGQENKQTKKSIGMALNEGYTEYLNKKYFNSILTSSYENEISIAERIEFIIGKEKMENLYFNANLQGLIDELSKYTTKKQAISIIKDLDKVMFSKEKDGIKKNKYSKIRNDIAKIYIEQQRQLFDEGKISEETFFERKIMYGNIYIAQNITLPDEATFYYDGNKIEIVGSDGTIIVDYHKKTFPNSNLSPKTHK